MTIAYNPGDTSKGQVAYAICLPENPIGLWWTWVHGIGERSDGTLDNLKNLVLGFDYNGDGKREPSVIPSEIFEAVDKYGITLVIPTYKDFFEPAKVNTVYDHVRAKYQLQERFVIDGFSYGGGAVLKYITSTPDNAKRIIAAIPVAPTNSSGGNWAIPGQVGLPVHVFVNKQDTNGPTNLSVTQSVVNNLNASKPALKIAYTAFNAVGHGGVQQSHTHTPPVAPNGAGIMDLSESIWAWAIDCFKNGPRAMKFGITEIPTTPPPVTTVPPSPEPSANEIVIKQTGTYPNIKLDASDTVNRKSVRWTVKSVPTGRSIWEPIVMSGQWHFTDVVLPTKGTYGIECYVTFKDNTTASKLLSITWGDVQEPTEPVPTEKKPIDFIWKTETIVFDDGSMEEISSAIFKTKSGKEYTI